MYLEALNDNPFESNCWLIAEDGSDEAVVVDPGFFPERLHAALAAAGKRPVAALATHGHFDHIGAAAGFCGADIPLFIHEADQPALADPGAWGAGFDQPPVPVEDVRAFAEGGALELAGLSFEVAHTPGHTPGSSCLLVGDLLLTGDLVFKGAIGRSDLPNSSPQDMDRSLRRFLSWADATLVLPGHGPATTIGEERTRNPFLVML